MSHYYRITVNVETERELTEETLSSITKSTMDAVYDEFTDLNIETNGIDAGHEEIPE